MTAEWLEWACVALADDDDVVVPVKKLWKRWTAEHATPDLAAFTAGVLADERVELMAEVDHAEGLEDLPADELAEHVRGLEALGYFSGPRVKLRARELTLAHIVAMITRHNDRMEAALRQAQAALPAEMDAQTAGLLSDLQARAAEFREQLRQAGLAAPGDEPASPA